MKHARMSPFSQVLTVALFLLTLCPAFAGTTGVLNGYARDENGQPTQEVTISAISSTGTYITHAARTGFYSFINLPPGNYTVNVEKLGFYPGSIVGVRINSDQTTYVLIRMVKRGCAGSGASAVIDQRAQDFTSFQLTQTERYPPGASLPAIPLPGKQAPIQFRCL